MLAFPRWAGLLLTDWKVNNIDRWIGVEMKLRARRKAQRPGEILEAAFEAFAERGFAATRMEDVAALAGVTKGAIYFYFETKEQLFQEMVRHYGRTVLADAEAMLASAKGSCTERLRALILFVYGRCAQDRVGREMIRFMVAEGKSFPQIVADHYSEFFAPAMQQIGDLLAQGAASGEFRPELAGKSPEIILAPMVFLSLMRLIFADNLRIDEGSYIDAHIELMLNGLLTSSARKP